MTEPQRHDPRQTPDTPVNPANPANPSHSNQAQQSQPPVGAPAAPSPAAPHKTQAGSASWTPAGADPRSPEEIEAAQAADAADATVSLQAELATLKVKSGELADQYLRAKAEADNARRRADEEVSKARKFAVEAFAESLLPVLDSLEAGLSIKDAKVEQIQEGSQATLLQLKAALERNKVIAIDPKAGEKFDPNIHHAISIVSPTMDSQQIPNTIVNVLQKGYTISERVLRPALVTVTAPS